VGREYLDGVSYTGFGDRVKRGKKWTRKVSLGVTNITLPNKGESIDYLEISGWNYGHQDLKLLVKIEERELIHQSLPKGQWKIRVKSEPLLQPSTNFLLLLNFQGSGRYVEIDELKIITKGITSRGIPRELLSRIPDNQHWSENETIVFEEIFEYSEHLKSIQFSGGEPLIHPLFSVILTKLINSGHASQINLYITSNGTVYSRHLSELLGQFASVELAFSIDGLGELQEYIRHPLKWQIITRNIFAFSRDNLRVSIRSTPQAYNIFGLLELARWCNEYQLPFFCENILWEPRFLSLDMLPQMVIDEVLHDWLNYLDTECTEDNRWQVKTVIVALQRRRPNTNELRILQEKFIRFTNDLDRSRKQSLANVCPRLYEHLILEGLDFSDKYTLA
jgi:glutamate-1-semialdehyde 2,1-aminomutase